MHVLLIEDEANLRATLTDVLATDHLVDSCDNGREGIYLAETNNYDLIILDVSLPDISGFEVCAALRDHKIATPILFLTAHADQQSRVRGLDLGGDDYVVKPFSIAELRARLRALTRRPPTLPEQAIITNGDFSLNTITKTATWASQTVTLRPKEYLLLFFLMRHFGQVVTKEQLWQFAWSFQAEPRTNTMEVQLTKLRAKLAGCNSIIIETIWGHGYKLTAAKANGAAN